MPTTAKKNALLEYKGHPLILESGEVKGMPVAKRVSVQLQQTNPNVRMKERIVKKTEKNSLWAAMDIASIWLGRALNSK